MRFDEKTNRYTLSTGRSFGAVEGAISPRDNGDLFQGFDGWLHEDIDAPLTDAERREIADYMIAAWQRWASVGSVVRAPDQILEELRRTLDRINALERPEEESTDLLTFAGDGVASAIGYLRTWSTLEKKKTTGARTQRQQRERVEEFHRGMIAALAVVRVHDAETIWREIIATEKGVTATARKSAELWEWGGFSRYVGKR